MTLLPPKYLDNVISLGDKLPDGKTLWCASGFLYGYFLKQENDLSHYLVFLVTNRHVFENKKNIIVRINKIDSHESKEYLIELINKDGKRNWFVDEDPDIDYAILNILPTKLHEDKIKLSYFRNNIDIVKTNNYFDLGISEGDSVFILGFPLGLNDPIVNFVIVRSGLIARMRDTLAGKSKGFIIDASVFPGNSGGPVINKPELFSIEGTKAVSKSLLLGIISSYITYQDTAVSLQTKRKRVIFEENSGLALVFPIDYVDRIIEKNFNLSGNY